MKHNLFYNASLKMYPPRISNRWNHIIISVNTFFYCFDSLDSATVSFEHPSANKGMSISYSLSFPNWEVQFRETQLSFRHFFNPEILLYYEILKNLKS